MITQYVVQPINRAQAKPAKASFVSRLKSYAKSIITPSRFAPATVPQPSAIKWTPQFCRAHSLQAPAKLPEDLRRRLFGLPPLDE